MATIRGSAAADSTDTTPAMWRSAGLTPEESVHLANESLRLAIGGQCGVGDMNFHKIPNLLPVEARGVGRMKLRPVRPVSFEVLDESELKARAEADGSYVYFLKFAEVTRAGDTVTIHLVNGPMYAAAPRQKAFGAGLRINFRREGTSWTHSCGPGWIS